MKNQGYEPSAVQRSRMRNTTLHLFGGNNL